MAVSERELMIKISGRVDNSLNSVGNKVDKEFQRMQKAAKTLGKVGAAALTGITMASINVGKDYEAQMSTVKAISGAGAEEMMRLEKKAQEMGATTKFTATESGQAMEYMAMAGWKSEQMLGGIDGIMQLAAASGEDLASVSDIVTDALTAFKLKAEDAGHFSDVLAAASSSSNTNVAMMGETFKYTASVAGALGYSIEDTAVSIGLLANTGIKASQGGTTLRKIMSETAGGVELMSKAYAKNGEKTGKLKIEAANADGSMKDWSVTVGRLREEFAKMTKEEQAANAENIAGKTAMAGLLAIVNASDEDYKKLTREINNAAGATERMSAIRLDNLEGDLTLFQSALEGKGIELYNEIKEPLRDLVQDATDWLEEIDVARVVDEFMNLGEGIMEFSEPLIDVGEWMLKNPEAIAGPLAGIGSAIVEYELFKKVTKFGEGINELEEAIVKHPWVAAGAAVVVAVTGTVAAMETLQQKMKAESLEDHFGDISLSMEQIEAAADKIIGSKKLEEVGNLLRSMKVSDGLLKDMDEASENIKKMDWKFSVGLKLSEEDMDEYEKNVQNYVSSAQNLIEEKGYSVSVATKFLFGETSWESMKENNNFYSQMQLEADELSKKINKKLKKAMKDGFTVDLQEELNGLLGQMSEITDTITEAENEASWDVLKTDFSGKELDADSFQEMQEKINDNISKNDEGAKAAYSERVTYLRARKKKGYLSEEEFGKQMKTAEEAYKKKKIEARQKGLEFQYNTLMDTYSEDIAKGEMDSGDWNALNSLLSSSDMIKQARDLITQAKADGMEVDTDFMEIVSKLEGMESASSGHRWQDAALDLVLPRDTEEYAKKFKDEKNLKLWSEGWTNKDNIDFSKFLIDPAREGGEKASSEIENTIQKELGKGISANVPVTLSGSFSFNGSVPVSNGSPSAGGTGGSGTSKKKNAGAAALFSPVPGHASGIISNKEHIAAVSEGNKYEAIIPIDGSERSRRLYEATGRMMGTTGQQAAAFAPHIEIHEIHIAGDASPAAAEKISAEVEKAVERAYRKMVKDKQRFNMR